jgi:hypothetical protein
LAGVERGLLSFERRLDGAAACETEHSWFIGRCIRGEGHVTGQDNQTSQESASKKRPIHALNLQVIDWICQARAAA